jgi:hypothetical protein
MKYLVILLFPVLAFSQKGKAKPDTCFTQSELADISFVLDSLWAADDINNELISKYRIQVLDQDSLIKLDSVQLALKDKEIALLNGIVANYKKLEPKFLDKKGIWFGFGFLAALGSGILINKLIR